MIDLSGLLVIIWRRKFLIALCAVVAVLVGWQVLKSIQPTYTAYSSILLDTRRQNVANVAGTVPDISITSPVVAGEIAIIRSNILIGEVVDALDLVNDPEFDPRLPPHTGVFGNLKRTVVGTATWLAALVSDGAEAPAPAAADGTAAAAAGLDPTQARHLVITDIQNRLEVSQIGISYVIGIWFDAADPDTAARVANAIAERYIADQIETKREAARRATGWLSDRIERLKAQVEEAEDKVVSFKADQARREGTVEANTQQLAGLNAEVIRARVDRLAAEVRQKHVSELLASGGLEAAAATVTSPMIEEQSRQKAELERKKAELSKWFGPKHPEIVALEAEIADVDRSIAKEVQRIVAGLNSEVDVQRAREAQISGSIDEAENRLVVLSETSVRLRQLERFADATRTVYETFLARYKETIEQTELQQADARIISRSEPPATPSHPRRNLILAGSGVLGLVLGFAVVFALELLSTTLRSPEALAEAAEAPVLAIMPSVGRARGRGWLSAGLAIGARSPFAEAARGLRPVIGLPREERGSVVMVTSALGGEGKSSTALALASVYSAVGLPAIAVECDLRRPSMDDYLGRPRRGPFRNSLNLVDYLEGKAKIDDIITVHPSTGITYIAARRVTGASSADLLASPRFDQLVDELTARYQVVVFDTPPALALSDALVLAPHASRILFTAMEGRTTRTALREGLDQIRSTGAHVTGVILCGASRSAMSSARRAALQYA